MYKLISWVSPLAHEAWFALLAQGDTVIEKGLDTVMKGGTDFGNASDSVRFGIILFALLAVIGSLAWLYVSGQRAYIKKLEARLATLEEEARGDYASHEKRYEELRNYYENLNRGYWGVLSKNNQEFASLNRVLENRELIVRRPPEPEPLPPPPSQNPTARPASFLPPRRRILPRAEPRDDQ